MLELRNKNLSVVISPTCGAGLLAFQAFGEDMLRRADLLAHDRRDPLGLSCFPMIPYVNRIAKNSFSFRGEAVTVPSPWAPHALHGFGWRTAWQVVSHAGQGAHLTFAAERGAWPWRYRCEQALSLEEDDLVVELAVQNLDDRPMPASLGLHPYFPYAGEATLQAVTEGVWLTDENVLPVAWQAAKNARVSFAEATPVAGTDLDNCYTGFDGIARVVWPRRGIEVTLASPQCRFLQVYTRGNDGSFCVEAQTAMPDAMNQHEVETTGVQTLFPDERLSCVTRFKVRRI